MAADNAGNDVIGFAPWVSDIQLTLSQLVIDSNVSIVGHGADYLTIDANDSSRIFSVDSGVQATISGMTITEGSVTGTNYGGAIRNAGDLTLNSVVVSDNHSAIHGGAIFNAVGAKLRVEDSTFTLNSATTGGAVYSASYLNDALVIERSTFYDNEASNAGALYLNGDDGLTGTATIRNSTFSGNRALSTSGGAIRNGASAPPLTIINSTIAYNTSVSGGGGIDMHNNPDNRFTLHNTILAHNDATSATTDNLNRAVNSASSSNVIGYGGTSGLTDGVAGNDLLGSGISAGLAPLGDYGGKTKTHALLVGSPALDVGNDLLAPAIDQRGEDRPDTTPGTSDIGAFEAGDFTTLTVRSDGDRNDSLTSQATIDSLRLREALALSAALAGKETIFFDRTGWADDEIQLSATWGYLSITSEVDVVGPGADKLTIVGAPSNRVMYVSPTANSSLISGMRITGGAATFNGGGVYVASPSTTIDRVQVDGNSATDGGGIYVASGAGLTLKNSTLWDNAASFYGGGLAAYGTANVTVLNSTIAENTAASGAGIYAYANTNVRVVNATIAGNTATYGGGGVLAASSSTVRLDNTIVAGNFDSYGAPDISGTFSTSSRHNLIGIDSVPSNGIDNGEDGNIVGGDAKLTALGYYNDGRMLTYALRDGSAAIDAGDDAIDDLFGIETDQRGFDRTEDNDYSLGDGIDIGALELAMDEIYA